MTCPVAPATLGRYLRSSLAQPDMVWLRAHLDTCGDCWSAWNTFRWDQAAGTPLYQELEAFLGDGFRQYFDSSRALAREWEHAAPATDEEIRDFYRSSVSYLYNLVIWHASGHRPPYVHAAEQVLAETGAAVVVDYGSGIGQDTIQLRHLGLHVMPCDYASPSTRFFQRCAKKLAQPTKVLEPDELDEEAKPDTLWIIDTLDHLQNLDQSLGHLLDTVRVVVCENLTSDRAHGQQAFHHRRSFESIACFLGKYDFDAVAPDTPISTVMHWTKDAAQR